MTYRQRKRVNDMINNNKKYTLEDNDLNMEKFIELTIYGVGERFKKWYFEFMEVNPTAKKHFKRLNGLV